MAAAAYRAAERLVDERQGMVHDYRRKGGVEHKEIMLPADAPAWCRELDRQALWNRVEAKEKRKDAQVARELRVMVPRELSPSDRIAVVRDYVDCAFVQRGMIADLTFHCTKASDGQDQPHAHVMLTMRPLEAAGFGPKSRHDFVPDPSGRTHPDGRPVMVESNEDSWNSSAYYERCREDWENIANAALERIGSAERIDRRSFLERGIARMPEPALRLAWYLKDLYGVMRERFGQFQVARHYRAVEERAQDAFRGMDAKPNRAIENSRKAQRFYDWFDRQLDRLAPERAQLRDPPGADRGR